MVNAVHVTGLHSAGLFIALGDEMHVKDKGSLLCIPRRQKFVLLCDNAWHVID
jgi:hypothetical protein